MNFADYIGNCNFSEATAKDYMGQYEKLKELLETDNIDVLVFTDLSLVLNGLKQKLNDSNYKLGLSSYKKKLDVLKKILHYIEVNSTINFFNEYMSMTLETKPDEFIILTQKQTACALVLKENYKKLSDELKDTWDKMKVNTSIKECRKHTYQDLKSKWLIQYEKATHLIKFTDVYDLVEEMDTVNGTKYRRNKKLIFIERCLLYGIYLHSPITEANNYKLPKTEVFNSLKTNSEGFNNPPSQFGGDVLTIFTVWVKLRKNLNFMNTDQVFYDKNIGNALKTWSSVNMFNNKKNLGTSITDLNYIIKNTKPI